MILYLNRFSRQPTGESSD